MHGTHSDLQDFNTETICGQRGLPMAAMLDPEDHMWQSHLVRGERLWGTIDGMTVPTTSLLFQSIL